MIPIVMPASPQSQWLRPIPALPRGDQWIAQAAFWARALGVLSIFAGGAILLPADWNVSTFPVQFYVAVIWAAPAPVYLILSFFLTRLRGIFCNIIAGVALVFIIPTLAAPLLDRQADFSVYQWYYLLALALVAGHAILAYLAYRARRALLDPNSRGARRRGFDILMPASHSILSDREK
jgi:hypothetical protein